MTIKYGKGNLFEKAPKGALLVHACNAQGVWGSGIAKQFKKLYPKSFEEYNHYCRVRERPGMSILTSENIGCLLTSAGYGRPLSRLLLMPLRIQVRTLYEKFGS